jgi:nucleotide-binding universal stress UspA family protein
MKNLLLATNLGVNSQQALERALLVARLHKAALHVIHVASAHDGSAEEELARQVAAAVAYLEAQLPEEFGAGFEPASFKSVAGDPVKAIVAEADTCDADLTITGLSEKLGARGLIDGTILERLLMASAKPSIVVKARPARNYESVLVGLDLSPTSRHALDAALRVAPTADFTIAHAKEAGPRDGDIADKLARTTRECLAAARKDVGIHEGAVQIMSEDGTVADVLSRCARKSPPDLVAFGKHNKGLSHGPYIGSGARGVLEELDADMLVVPPGD